MIFLLLCIISQLVVFAFIISCRNVTVVICDSRGVPVRRRISDDNVICEAVRGARLQDVPGLADELISRYNPATCLIIAGINNMTIMNRRTRKVSLVYYDPFELANHVIRLINRIRTYLTGMHRGVRFGFGGMIGIDLNHYNSIEGYSPFQWVVDEAVRQINAYVRLLNQQCNLYHPRLTSKVHSFFRGRPKNHYRLLRDGLHLGNILITIWARNIVRFHLVNTIGIQPFWSGILDMRPHNAGNGMMTDRAVNNG